MTRIGKQIVERIESYADLLEENEQLRAELESATAKQSQCGWESHGSYYTTGCGEEVYGHDLLKLGWTFCPWCGSRIAEESSGE